MVNNKVSIIMSTYNRNEYLRLAINSVLNQTYENFELIIIDDCSQEEYRDVVSQFDDSRIKYYYMSKNRNCAFARTVGLEYATGKYIAIVDSDDIWEKEKLEKQVSFLENHIEYGACFSYVNIIDKHTQIANEKFEDIYNLFNTAENKLQGEWIKFFLKKGNCLCTSSAVIRKDVLDEAGEYFDLAFLAAEDYELWMRLVVKKPIYIMNEKLVQYRWCEGEGQISGKDEKAKATFANSKTIMQINGLDYLTNEEFKKIFGSEFVNRKSSTDEEIAFEKAIFLARLLEDENKLPVLLRMKKILRTNQDELKLEKRFGFNLQEYYKIYRKMYILDSEHEAQLTEYEKLKEVYNETLTNLERITEELNKAWDANRITSNELNKALEANEITMSELNKSLKSYEQLRNQFEDINLEYANAQEELNIIKTELETMTVKKLIDKQICKIKEKMK